MPTPSSQHPDARKPADSQPEASEPGNKEAGHKEAGHKEAGHKEAGEFGRGACRRAGERPLPDPSAVWLSAVPDSAPPYDDALAGPLPAGPVVDTDHAGGPDHVHRPDYTSDGRSDLGQPEQDAATGKKPTGGGPGGPGGPAGWPSQFAQVLAETLAGSRPPGQMVPWTTERARSSIQRLGSTLTAGQPTARQRPLVRRVVTSRPNCDVLEMTVVVGFGPRVRALAVRLERSTPRDAGPGRAARTARWLCTTVEAA
jgi:hypothetical protein